jgi:hypothetical protein
MPIPLSCSDIFDPLGEFCIDETGGVEEAEFADKALDINISLEFSKFVVQTNSQDTVTLPSSFNADLLLAHVMPPQHSISTSSNLRQVGNL